MKSVLILYNPSSAGGRSEKKRSRIEKKLEKWGIPYKMYVTDSEKDLKLMASKAADDKMDIIAVGGDTTFTFVVQEILKSRYRDEINFGMIGTGSVNDIVRGIGMDDVDLLLSGIKKGLTHKIDIGRVEILPEGESYFFLGSLGIGLGTTVNKFIENWKEKKIMITKIKPAMELSGFIKGIRGSFSDNKVPIKVKIEWEGQKIERDVTILVFQNTPLYSRSLKLSPDASPYDNILDCAVINTRSLTNTVGVAVSIMRNKHAKRPELEILRSKEFELTSAEKIDIAIDGDIVEGVSKIRVSLLKNGLNIFQPDQKSGHLPQKPKKPEQI